MEFWVLQCQHHGICLTEDLISTKAQRFAESFGIPDDMIAFSQRWLHKFQQRHKLHAVRIHGESGSAVMAALEAALPELKSL